LGKFGDTEDISPLKFLSVAELSASALATGGADSSSCRRLLAASLSDFTRIGFGADVTSASELAPRSAAIRISWGPLALGDEETTPCGHAEGELPVAMLMESLAVFGAGTGADIGRNTGAG
jgi:hypothetical protein